MSLPTIEQIKVQLRMEPDEQAPGLDDELQALLDDAVDYASQFLGRPIPWTEDSSVPGSVRRALLLIVSDLFNNREGQFVGVTAADNPAVVRMLHFYRVGLGA